MDILISGRVLSDIDLRYYSAERDLKDFRGFFIRNTLPNKPRRNECGIPNLSTDRENGSHWVAWYKRAKNSLLFDSFAQDIPNELETYFKSTREYAENDAVVLCNSVISANSSLLTVFWVSPSS